VYRLLAGPPLLWLTACALFPGQAVREPVRTYVLAAGEPAVRAAAQGQGPRVLVSLPQAWPGYDSSRIAYVKRPEEMNYYAYSEWVDTPSRLIAPLLVRALERSGRFGAVLFTSSSAVADLRLDTELVSLQQEFYTYPSQGRVILRAQLINLTTGRVLRTQTFQAVTPAATEDPYGGVRALSQSLRRVLNEIVAFCIESAKSPP
jgi:cholesterol transport system auxiliary component